MSANRTRNHTRTRFRRLLTGVALGALGLTAVAAPASAESPPATNEFDLTAPDANQLNAWHTYDCELAKPIVVLLFNEGDAVEHATIEVNGTEVADVDVAADGLLHPVPLDIAEDASAQVRVVSDGLYLMQEDVHVDCTGIDPSWELLTDCAAGTAHARLANAGPDDAWMGVSYPDLPYVPEPVEAGTHIDWKLAVEPGGTVEFKVLADGALVEGMIFTFDCPADDAPASPPPAPTQPAPDQPVPDQPVPDQPTAHPQGPAPLAEQPDTEEPATDGPTTDGPATEGPATEGPDEAPTVTPAEALHDVAEEHSGGQAVPLVPLGSAALAAGGGLWWLAAGRRER